MSHLKEPVVITFTAFDLSNNDYVLIFNSPFLFTFNAGLVGSYGWINSTASMSSDAFYYIRNETQNTSVGRIDIIKSTAQIEFESTDSQPVFVAAGDVLTVSSPATNSIGMFGVSLVGER